MVAPAEMEISLWYVVKRIRFYSGTGIPLAFLYSRCLLYFVRNYTESWRTQ